MATDECEYPNGLALSPDESVLYVAISRLDNRCVEEAERGEVCTHRRIRAFDVAADGTLNNNRVFCDMSSAEPGVPDGMKVDTAGRVYCTGSGGIWVIDPQGNRLGTIRVPEVPRNLAFGGPGPGYDVHYGRRFGLQPANQGPGRDRILTTNSRADSRQDHPYPERH